MKEKRSLLNLAIFAVVVIATTVWVLYILNRAEAEIEALSNAPVYLSRRLATDDIDTSQWKTYRNEKYGFEVRYPQNYNIDYFLGAGEDSTLDIADYNFYTDSKPSPIPKERCVIHFIFISFQSPETIIENTYSNVEPSMQCKETLTLIKDSYIK